MKREILSEIITYLFLLLIGVGLIRWIFKKLFRNRTSLIIILRFWAFLRQPYYTDHAVPVSITPLRWLWQLFRVNFGITLFVTIISVTLAKLIEQLTSLNFHRDHVYSTPYQTLFFLVIFAPIIEEGIFRLSLRLSPFNLAFMIGLVGAYLALPVLSSWFQFNTYIVLAIASCVLFMPTFVLVIRQASIIEWLYPRFKKHFRWIYYFSSISFGFIHLSNFDNITLFHYLLVPLLTLPQLCSGFFWGYIRMRYGIGYSMALHALNNLIPGLLYILSHRTELS